MGEGKVGEYVAIEFSSADASTAAAVTLKDSEGATRTLASNERLLIDSLSGAAVMSDTASTDIIVTVFDDIATAGTVNAGERILVFRGSGIYDGGEEGYSCKVGDTPKVKASAAGQVDVTGVGRIVRTQITNVRPTWKQVTTT